jgi:hypothetical protein
MVDARVEIGVVADGRRKVQRALRRRVQHRLQRGLPGCPFGQQLRQPHAKRLSCFGAGGHERIERAVGRQRGGMRRLAGEQAGARSLLQIEDGIADRHARASRRRARGREHAERQVLHGEVRVPVGRGNPASPCGIVCVIESDAASLHRYRRSGVKCFWSRRP